MTMQAYYIMLWCLHGSGVTGNLPQVGLMIRKLVCVRYLQYLFSSHYGTGLRAMQAPHWEAWSTYLLRTH